MFAIKGISNHGFFLALSISHTFIITVCSRVVFKKYFVDIAFFFVACLFLTSLSPTHAVFQMYFTFLALLIVAVVQSGASKNNSNHFFIIRSLGSFTVSTSASTSTLMKIYFALLLLLLHYNFK